MILFRHLIKDAQRGTKIGKNQPRWNTKCSKYYKDCWFYVEYTFCICDNTTIIGNINSIPNYTNIKVLVNFCKLKGNEKDNKNDVHTKVSADYRFDTKYNGGTIYDYFKYWECGYNDVFVDRQSNDNDCVDCKILKLIDNSHQIIYHGSKTAKLTSNRDYQDIQTRFKYENYKYYNKLNHESNNNNNNSNNNNSSKDTKKQKDNDDLILKHIVATMFYLFNDNNFNEYGLSIWKQNDFVRGFVESSGYGLYWNHDVDS